MHRHNDNVCEILSKNFHSDKRVSLSYLNFTCENCEHFFHLVEARVSLPVSVPWQLTIPQRKRKMKIGQKNPIIVNARYDCQHSLSIYEKKNIKMKGSLVMSNI